MKKPSIDAELLRQYEEGPGPAPDPDPAIFMGYTAEELRAIVQHYQTMTGLADRDQDIAVLREQQERERRDLARAATKDAAPPPDWEAREREQREGYALEEKKAQADYEIRDYATALGRVEGALGYPAVPSSPAPLPGPVTQVLAQVVLDLLRRQMHEAERRRNAAEQQLRERASRRD
jgi:hypothetical protein